MSGFEWRNAAPEGGGGGTHLRGTRNNLDADPSVPAERSGYFSFNFPGMVFFKRSEASLTECDTWRREPSVPALNFKLSRELAVRLLSVEGNKCHSSRETGLFNAAPALFTVEWETDGRSSHSH